MKYRFISTLLLIANALFVNAKGLYFYFFLKLHLFIFKKGNIYLQKS